MSQDEEKTQVGNLTPQSRRINVTVKVVSKNPVREVVSRRDGSTHRVTEALVGDETGSILLNLWDDTIESVSEDDVIDILNGYINLFRGSMRLNIGRYGTLNLSEEEIEEVNIDNNLSDQQFEQERRYSGYRQSYQRGGYGRRRRY